MIESDTIKLLRECDAGTKMGINSIDEVIRHVSSDTFKARLNACKDEHAELEKTIESELAKYKDEGKSPSPVAKGMASMKTNMKLMMSPSDRTIADLMIDGCNMGVKSLNRYLNQYEAADEVSKDIAKRLIHLEEKLCDGAKEFL